MKHRSRNEIVGEILNAADEGATKTKIMFLAYLSYAQLKEYLSTLTENGLLEYLEGKRLYKTTEKGQERRRLHSQMDGLSDGMKKLSA